MAITTKNFQLLGDNQLAWDLMIENYAPCCVTGMPAPFFEYALTSSWMDKRFTYLNRFWLDEGKPVGFVFYESPLTNVFFHLLPGYEFLAEEMIAYADSTMPGKPGEKELVFFPAQTALMEAAQKLGYAQAYAYDDMLLNFHKTVLNRPLPEGYHWVDPSDVDPVKLAICCWKGFNHEDKGPFENWDGEDPGTDWNPVKSYQGIVSSIMAPPPHSTYEYDVIIADATGEYVCYSGMWWVEENKLAYMEPLCTVPEHRGKGLAAAALTRHYQQMGALGAEYMTGGGDPFYRKIGYTEAIRWAHWKKQ
ncbi:MAG: GNAT family N-acetyltransferase [Clostridiales bacterium]|nr:GNAT family N-acetyltransferase [Clostridiales bacterium]